MGDDIIDPLKVLGAFSSFRIILKLKFIIPASAMIMIVLRNLWAVNFSVDLK